MKRLPSAIAAVLTASQIDDLHLATSHLTGPKNRSFQAQIWLKYCKGKPRLTKKVFGWYRVAVALPGFLKRVERNPGKADSA